MEPWHRPLQTKKSRMQKKRLGQYRCVKAAMVHERESERSRVRRGVQKVRLQTRTVRLLGFYFVVAIFSGAIHTHLECSVQKGFFGQSFVDKHGIIDDHVIVPIIMAVVVSKPIARTTLFRINKLY